VSWSDPMYRQVQSVEQVLHIMCHAGLLSFLNSTTDKHALPFCQSCTSWRLHGSQCHYFTFNIQHLKLFMILESCVWSLNTRFQQSFLKYVCYINVAICILWKGRYEWSWEEMLRWCSTEYSPSTWVLHDETSTTVFEAGSCGCLILSPYAPLFSSFSMSCTLLCFMFRDIFNSA
jgi:hypothetical protein